MPADKVVAHLMKDAAMPAAKASPRAAVSTAVHRVPDGRAPTKGGAQAKVTIDEFCEIECPYCRSVQPTLQKILDTYGDEVRIAWKHRPMPMHRNSALAAMAAEAAQDQGRFWQMHDKLFASQGALDRASLERYAAELGLDMPRWKATLARPQTGALIDADAQEAGRFAVDGTPSFFVNGRFMAGAQLFEAFKAVIDEEIKKADAKLAAGVPRGELYAAFIAGGLDKATPPLAEAPSRPGTPEDPTVYQVEPGDAPARGPRNAPITVVLFSDFECPFCGKVEPTIAQLEKAYPGKVRVVWKNFPLPFHANAKPAAAAALAAGEQGKFWPMHRKLFENQRALDGESLRRYARELGLDMRRFEAALASNKFAPVIEAETKQGRAIGVTGTPASFVNGRKIVGAQPLEVWKQIVEQELGKRARVAGRRG
jgi:protein-disulfide isomerase